MKVVAKLHFSRERDLVDNFASDTVKDALEKRINVKIDKVNRIIFIAKIVPVFVFCGASIIAVTSKDNYSYEVQVEDEEKFIQNINEFVDRIIEVS